jgi:nucleoside-diphosphate-sugar epimerase
MRVFVAGATGVLGREAVAALVSAGHEVTGLARTQAKADLLLGLGAHPVTLDLFDPAAATTAVRGHDAVCNLATNIPTPSRYFRRSPWRTNDRLHRDGSRILVDAALATGASRYVQHSVAFMYADGGDAWLDEACTLDPPPHGLAVMEAEAQARRFTEAGGSGVSMRFGLFYGIPAKTATDLIRVARLGFVPFPGRRDAYLSWIHTEDLGPAVVAALDAPPGAYNVVDDEPLTRNDWATTLAKALGRKRLRSTGRLVSQITGKRYDYISRSQRVSNARFKNATGWSPSVPSARDGWPQLLSALSAEVP